MKYVPSLKKEGHNPFHDKSDVVYDILESSLSYDIMPKSIDQDGEAFGRQYDTSLYLLR